MRDRMREHVHNSQKPGSTDIKPPKRDVHETPVPHQIAILNHQRRLMSTPELAETLNVSLSWVNKAHVYGTGPPAVRVGRRRLYDPVDVDNWLATKRQQNTSEQI